MIARVVAFTLTLGLVFGVRQFAPSSEAHQIAATMALGLILVGAFLAGWISSQAGLPKLTGYMVFGLIAGPPIAALFEVKPLLEQILLDDLKPVDGVAVALIALHAGAELEFSWLKKHAFRVLTVCFVLTVVALAGIVGLVMLLEGQLPFMTPFTFDQKIMAAVLIAISMATTSPLVILAVTNETAAKGPMTDMLLGVAILLDLIIVVLMAVALGIARGTFDEGSAVELSQVTVTLLKEIFGSLGAGALLGGLLVLYLRFVGQELALVIAGLCLAISEVATRLHLEPLLVAIVAGMVMINFGGPRFGRFIHALERVSLPVYALFFGLLGANLDLRVLAALGLVGGAIVAARAFILWASTGLGATIARAEPEVRKYTWLGFVSQAGVTLGLAVTIHRTFPEWGGQVRDLIIGIAAVNTLAGPILHRVALIRGGEAGKGEDVDPLSAH